MQKGLTSNGKNNKHSTRSFTQKHLVANQVFLSEFGNNLVDTACEFAKTCPVYIVRPIPEHGYNTIPLRHGPTRPHLAGMLRYRSPLQTIMLGMLSSGLRVQELAAQSIVV